MAKKNESKEQPKIQYRGLRVFLDGLTVGCLIITIIVSLNAGADAGEIAKRGLIVVASLLLISNVLIRSWRLWSQLKDQRG